jgi:hypothetical protein
MYDTTPKIRLAPAGISSNSNLQGINLNTMFWRQQRRYGQSGGWAYLWSRWICELAFDSY